MSKPVNETAMHKNIRQAIIRIEKGRPKIVDSDRKMSVMAVAEEAGVSRALIVRDYHLLYERILGGKGKARQQQIDEKQQQLNKSRDRSKELRGELEELKAMNAYLQSKNATLIMENKRLLAQAVNPSNVVPLK
ncbi:TetR family transcriptional regulator [Paraglaciecola sp.]|uniref:TetR family transcriptional regulator n=1 Tax=Paraglaciecola sp. TaxID=1920173 RepID=UPI003EF37864